MKLTRPTQWTAQDDDPPLDSVDLANADLYGAGDPHRVWHALRGKSPVAWRSVAGGSGFWAVTTMSHVRSVLRDATLFTSRRGTTLANLGGQDPASGWQMVVTDPPRLTRLREPAKRALTGTALGEREDHIRFEIRRLVQEAPDRGWLDLAGLASNVSVTIACLFLGLPFADRDALTNMASRAVAPEDPAYADPAGVAATLRAAHRELFAYFFEAVDRKAGQATEDVLSRLAEIHIDGAQLPVASVVANGYNLLIGAVSTTPHVLTAALLELIESGAYASWANNTSVSERFVEEAARWSSPANHFMRYATSNTMLGNATIREGDAVVVWPGSANRDEASFADPYRFDPNRTPNPHIAFGAGPHYCVGQALARLVLRVAFEEIAARYRAIELAGPVVHLHSTLIAGIRQLPVQVLSR